MWCCALVNVFVIRRATVVMRRGKYDDVGNTRGINMFIIYQ